MSCAIFNLFMDSEKSKARSPSPEIIEDIQERIFNGQISYENDNSIIVVKRSLFANPSGLDNEEDFNNNNNNNNNSNSYPTSFDHKNNLTINKELESPKFLLLFNCRSEKSAFENRLLANEPDSESRKLEALNRVFALYSLSNPDDERSQQFLHKHQSSSSVSDVHRQDPLLMCFPCRLSFTFGPSFAGHVVNCHGLDLSDPELELFEENRINAVLGKIDDCCLVWYMEPLESLEEITINKSDGVSQSLVDIIKRKINASKLDKNPLSTKNNKVIDPEHYTPVKNDGESDTGNSKELGSFEGKDLSALISTRNFFQSNKTVSGEKEDKLQSQLLKNAKAESVLDLSAANDKEDQPHSNSAASASFETIAKRPMLDCETMSFALASPLDAHVQPPTSHSLMLSNMLHKKSKQSDVELSPFLARRNNENENMSDKNRYGDSSTSNDASSPPATSSVKRETQLSPVPVSSVLNSSSSSLLGNTLGMTQSSGVDTLVSKSSSIDPMFPMSLFQSRNSCKTLKCPKCNWHYKYRQTLEAHMKEKHFEETSDCIYCKAGQPHPRLSRGESYSCGYKPFKCNICNYSTTTKGNLSIHMQSDKHLYNARSLQHRQQEQMRQGESGSSTFPLSSSSSNSDGKLAQNESLAKHAVSSSGKIAEYNDSSLDKQFHAKRRRSSNKTNSSIDSSVFTSSSKHNSPTMVGVRRDSSSTSSGGKWRCDVCCYETGIARNLRIHMTSEKHAQNVALSERGLLNHMKNNEDSTRIRSTERNQTAEASQMSAQNLMDYYAALKTLQQGPATEASSKNLPLADDVRKAHAQYLQHQLYLAQQQQLLLAQQYQQLMMAAAASSLHQRLSQPSSEAASLTQQIKQNESLVQNPLWKQLLPQANVDSMSSATNEERIVDALKNEESSSVFSCGICCTFATDDVNALESHVRKQRQSEGFHEPTSSEWVVKTRNRDKENYYCKLCSYSTPLKTNFNLHCKTEKHTCKLSLICHVREGGSATAWMIPHAIRGALSQNVSCNICQFVTQSFEKLKLHCASEQHQGVVNVCQYLQSLKKNKEASQSDEKNNFHFRCQVCSSFTTKNAIEIIKHMRSQEHQLQLQSRNFQSLGALQDMITVEAIDQASVEMTDDNLKEETKPNNIHCEFCNYSCEDQTRIQLHVVMQHSDNPPSSCPLCQELLNGPMQLRLHLAQAHQLQIPSGGRNELIEEVVGKATQGAKGLLVPSNEEESPAETYRAIDASIEDKETKMDCSQPNTNLAIDENEENGSSVTKENVRSGISIAGQNVDPEEKPTTPSSSEDKLEKPVMKNLLDYGSIKSETSGRVQIGTSNRQKIRFKNEENPLSHQFRSSSLARSCPNLLETATFPQEPNEKRKGKRNRMRSFEGVARSSAYYHLLSKYGLEQAQHYVENRSPRNKNRARSFKSVKSDPNWSSSLSEPDIAEKEKILSAKKDIDFVRQNQSIINESEMDAESLRCSHCGKTFSDVWVLKTHEEVAHGILVPSKSVESAGEVYSETIMKKHGDDDSKSKEDQNKIPELLEAYQKRQSKSVDSQNSVSGNDNLLKQNVEPMSLMQQQQNQAFLQALMKMQSLKQAGLLENEPSRNVDDLQLGASTGGDPSQMSSNFLSQMGMYSALLQTHALGIHPYQMLSNVAALQQMQHLSNSPVLGLTEEVNRTSGNVYPKNLGGGTSNGSLDNQQRSSSFDQLPKQELNSLLESNQQLLSGHIQSQTSLEIPAKRPRTRITDEQLKILRANFDINNSPSEDQVDEMAQRTSLPPKVIKHWFRNTLFKERQRSKDSPYNFNIPPVMSLEDAQKTSNNKQEEAANTSSVIDRNRTSVVHKSEVETCPKPIESALESHQEPLLNKTQSDVHGSTSKNLNKTLPLQSESFSHNLSSALFTNALSSMPSLSPTIKSDSSLSEPSQDAQAMLALSLSKHMLNSRGMTGNFESNNNDSYMYDMASGTDAGNFSSLSGGICRRTPRTRFTDFQLQVLQDFFDRNAYPKDDDLDKLSQTLQLSTRVIVVWFQNARQKARKSFEQQQQQQKQQHPIKRSLSPDFAYKSSVSENHPLLPKSIKIDEDLAPNPSSAASFSKVEKSNVFPATSTNEKVQSAVSSNDQAITRKRESTSAEKFSCQLCDKELSSPEEWQLHQQDHLKSIYSQMYVNNLIGQQLDESIAVKKPSEFPVIKPKLVGDFPVGGEASSLLNAVKMSASIQNRSSNEEEKLAALSKILASDRNVALSMSQPQSSSPSLLGASKRKSSSSPTFNNFPNLSKLSIPSSSTGFQNKMASFGEEKDIGGMQKDPKRLRTTITPNQLEYLYQQYLFDSSPSRKVIEQISEVVGLKKRVVQVWFQNTRARERKGQFRSSITRCVSGQLSQNKVCQLCRIVFRSKEELDHHMQTKHTTQVTEAGTRSVEEPVDKKMRIASGSDLVTEATGLDSNSPVFQAVKNMMESDKFKSAASNLKYMMSTSIDSHNALQTVKSESIESDSFRESQTKEGNLPILSALKEENQQNQTSPSPSFLTSESQSKLTSMYETVTCLSDGMSSLSNSSPRSTNSHTEMNSSFSSTVSELPSLHQTTASLVSEPQETARPRDLVQQISMQSSAPSMVVSNSLMDLGFTPTKRHRTQMTSVQIRALKHCFKAFKTPSLAECELIGNEIGLLKRVVQVWFQNSRAKEKKKKAKQSSGNSLSDFGDLLESDELPRQCDTCVPPVFFTSSQQARHHFFSRDHLQKLLRMVETEKKHEQGSGFGSSLGSPCSSFDSSEMVFQMDQLGSESPSDPTSPVSKHNNQASSSSPMEFYKSYGSKSPSSINHQPDNSHLLGNEKKVSESRISEPGSDLSQLFESNPNLMQHYSKALQQLLVQQREQESSSNSGSTSDNTEQQALFQQALQNSLYQIFKLPKTSSSEN